ncbi:MAG: hypothetical protein FWD27_09525 [Coriobacteriia bacterium]|nr:hypothetical protein [Coriobacteriia bacterium]
MVGIRSALTLRRSATGCRCFEKRATGLTFLFTIVPSVVAVLTIELLAKTPAKRDLTRCVIEEIVE